MDRYDALSHANEKICKCSQTVINVRCDFTSFPPLSATHVVFRTARLQGYAGLTFATSVLLLHTVVRMMMCF